jgi:hypothetical protein
MHSERSDPSKPCSACRSAEALAEAKGAIGSSGGYDVEMDRDEADRLAADEAGREELFMRLVQQGLAEWIELG